MAWHVRNFFPQRKDFHSWRHVYVVQAVIWTHFQNQEQPQAAPTMIPKYQFGGCALLLVDVIVALKHRAGSEISLAANLPMKPSSTAHAMVQVFAVAASIAVDI